jgi:hypothetical protein
MPGKADASVASPITDDATVIPPIDVPMDDPTVLPPIDDPITVQNDTVLVIEGKSTILHKAKSQTTLSA